MTAPLQAPFPWFGGKRRVASLVWDRFGDVPNYVEPFFGSGAVLLGRPHTPRVETVNDKDALLANFWRAVQRDPEGVAAAADWPVNEVDLYARHCWLVSEGAARVERLRSDPDYYDVQTAGWWVWGLGQWIGGGWCEAAGRGVHRQMPSLSAPFGVHRQMPSLHSGMGVHRKTRRAGLTEWMITLAERLRAVRVCCGDWSRIVGHSATTYHGVTAVFLDPPYLPVGRERLYRVETDVGAAVRAWARTNGDNPQLRIALCGYDGEHDLPGWSEVHWKAQGGYANQAQGRGRANAAREVIWFSPHCLTPTTEVGR